MKAIARHTFRLLAVIGLSGCAWMLSISYGQVDEHQQAIGEAAAKLPIFDAHMHVSDCVNVYQNGQFENAAFFRHETCWISPV